MPLSIKQNLAEDVIAILNAVKRYRLEASTHPNFSIQDTLQDIETHLCDLLTSMISSPLTGRIFLLPPSAYVTEQEREESVRRGLLCN
tara:strand:+ start:63 stop:326 length:264 start_codon:yes stop_codon:yes gene_type:complete